LIAGLLNTIGIRISHRPNAAVTAAWWVRQ
jgi:hypothetical protein